MPGSSVYFSDLLPQKHCIFWNNLKKILEDLQVGYHLLPHTKDIRARDYMPVQVESHLIQFRYDPDYLAKDPDLRTDLEMVTKAMDITTRKSSLIVDGGNVITGSGYAFLTEKVFKENKTINSDKIISTLSELLHVKVIILPILPYDWTGHSDGMVRITNGKLVMGDISSQSKSWQKRFKKAVGLCPLEKIILPYPEIIHPKKKHDHAIGCYTNYLELEHLIIMPSFGLPEDEKAMEVMRSITDKKVVNLNCTEIAMEGGVLNCISWAKQ
ncbi:MAG: agmatine deiminase family protein [Cytophagaceae bacterium]